MSRPHGYARYRLDACRCYVCAVARSDYDQHRNRQIAYGRWHPFTDLDLVREHIAVLRAIGYGDRTIALLASLGRKTIRDIRTGIRHDPGRANPKMTKIRAETAAAILAIPTTTEQAADGARIDATRTWQQIHALIAAGYPRSWIAQQAGLGRAIQLRRDRITARNARRIADLHQRVGLSLGPSERARAEGHRNGWPTPFDLAESSVQRRHVRRRPWIRPVDAHQDRAG